MAEATSNGKVTTEVAEQAVAAVVQSDYRPRMYRLTTDEFCGRDIKRARVMLGGRNPWEILDGEDEDRFTLIIWCLKSRHIPGLTWEDAEATPYGEFLPPGDLPPQTPPLETSGSSGTTPSESGSKSTRQRREPAPSSVSSTT
jgi:hypothetical protein